MGEKTPTTTTNNNKKKSQQQFEYEFGGPIGAFMTVALLPVVVMCFSHFSKLGKLDFTFVKDIQGYDKFWDGILNSNVFCPSCMNSNDDNQLLLAFGGIIAYFSFQVGCERFLPCELVQGLPVKGDVNNRLTYRINGHLAFWVTLLVLQIGWPSWHVDSQTYQFGPMPISILYDYHGELALSTIIFCFALSFYLYTTSFVGGGTTILADGGDSGNPIYDFFMGRELNPRIGNFDWKEFCELRPGLIGWMILNLSFMAKQQEKLGYVSGSMILINIFQGVYVWDALYQERAILSTMDITTDGFGFMLCFGDLAWVPFTYSIQAKYLVEHDPHLSYTALAAILAFQLCGYAIFRGANSQKDAFRRDPNHPSVSHLSYLKTKRGTKLLTSGWWGMARKINYTGDYIMGLSWCLVCGFDSIVPYFYAVYFAILLVHRATRDDHMCKEKYGEDWEVYKKQVPYMFIPGVV